MKTPLRATLAASMLLCLALAATALAENAPRAAEPSPPHTPTLIFYLSGAEGPKDAKAIGNSVAKLKIANVVDVDTERGYARIRFDSHVVSYHQVAQAIAEAGKTLGKTYDPYLIFTVTDYAKSDHAAKVDGVFAGKRLNQRVHLTPVNKDRGIFAIHFLPLMVDPKDPSTQGFNGGHLHHPISDPPPRGLGLESGYASDYDATLAR